MHRLGIVVGAVTLGWVAAAPGQPPADDALTRAADCLDRGDESAAVPHLREHLAAHPESLMIRAHLAEVLLKQGKAAEARSQFERFVVAAQQASGQPHEHLVHCHTRLMGLAAEAGDAYRAELNRGIGLVLLVRRWDAEPGRRDVQAAEQTLAKAVHALRAAADARPGDARAYAYLAETYERLGQPAAARSARRTAQAGLPDPAVTPAEERQIRGGQAVVATP